MKEFTENIVNKFSDMFEEEVEFEQFLKVICKN